MIIRSAAFLILMCTPASAAVGPSFDCAKAGNTVETLICADSDLARLDRRLSERYAAARDVPRGSDGENVLRAMRRGWIGGRDEYWKSDDLRACVEAACLTRETALVAGWRLEEPTGTAFRTRDNSPANEVVTMVFATKLPGVRFERGDTIDIGSLVPSSSGSKYMGSFRRSIWINGDEAIYRDWDPDGREMTCTLSREG